MLYWLSLAAKQMREEADRLQVHVAASLSKNQSTIARFEDAQGWPRNVDLTVAAYADDLGVHPRELWARALELWSSANGSSKT
jgi:hypothetical protein